jgi:hypothetical protein
VTFVDTTKECEAHRDNLKAWVERIGKRVFRKKHGRAGTKADTAEHGLIYKDVAGTIKVRAGVLGSWDKSSKHRSQNPLDYKKWTAAAEALWMEVNREEAS